MGWRGRDLMESRKFLGVDLRRSSWGSRGKVVKCGVRKVIFAWVLG